MLTGGGERQPKATEAGAASDNFKSHVLYLFPLSAGERRSIPWAEGKEAKAGMCLDDKKAFN